MQAMIPTYHPAAVLREWSWRAIGVADLKRAARFRNGEAYPTPSWQFIVRPTYDQVIRVLSDLQVRADVGPPLRLSFDLETRSGHIACAGISWSKTDAISVPFMCVESREGYWSENEEAEIVFRLYRILTHPQAQVVGQNLLYDAQYTWRHWLFVPHVVQDTMIGQHAIFSDLPKGLAFLASMYCDSYVFWKDEGKNWDPKVGEDQLWRYNCQDCVYTDEVGLALSQTAEKLGLGKVVAAQQAMFWPVLQCMQRGVAIDLARRNALIAEVQEQVSLREQFLLDILGHPINPRSAPQMQSLFYADLAQPVQMTRAAKGAPARPTLNDEALQKLALREPLLKPLINAISDIRTLGIFLSNFLTAPLDSDGRMRCAYNIGGSASGKSAPKTYRLSSSENAFGSGTNLQNIPSEKSKSVGKAIGRGGISFLGDPYAFPNIRSMFVPDPGWVFWNGDLDRADLQVVVWEAGDEQLKTALHMGVDLHLLNAFVLMGKEPPPLEELVESHPRYADLRGPLEHSRQFAKVFVHGTNYGGGARTMATHTGVSVHDVERAQQVWFGAHPGIKKWHDRVVDQVRRKRYVENRFGYRWYIFDRIDSIIPEAIAWIPQSTVSVLINKIWMRIYEEVPDIQVLLQCHDSLGGQMQTNMVSSLLPLLKEQFKVIVPYDDPLVIPASIQLSEKSWGDCQ